MESKVEKLLEIMSVLRDPAHGCPWDLEQTFASIAPFTLEEAYEVIDAIQREDAAALREELGDLLFQVVFHSRLAEEKGQFDFAGVVEGISDKLVRRHPHVFGDADINSSDGQTRAWEALKAAERADKAGPDASALQDVPLALPALSRAAKLGRRASRTGFDWPEVSGPMEKIDEEWAELRAEIDGKGSRERLEDELGDLLFAVVNLARHLKLDPEAALRRTNAKFERRFRAVEAGLAAKGLAREGQPLEVLDRLWNEAKRRERSGSRNPGDGSDDRG
ncbi:MAG: nucleoside triphosphate pyrophosphohydrolase [Gammaproteobacteria bacterium]|jgi:MazG family protein